MVLLHQLQSRLPNQTFIHFQVWGKMKEIVKPEEIKKVFYTFNIDLYLTKRDFLNRIDN